MLLGRFNDAGEHAGRSIVLDDNALSVEGHGAISFSAVADADIRGEVAWEGPAFRTWALNRATDEGWTAPTAPETPVEVPVTAEAPKTVAAPKPEPVAAAPRPAAKPKTDPKADAKAAAAAAKAEAKAAKAAEKAAADKARAEERAAAAAAKAEAKAAADASKAEAKAASAAAKAAKPEPKPEPKPAAPAPSAEKKASREGRTMLSPGAKVALGVIATLVLAAVVALSLGNPMPRKELPTVQVETTAETAGTTASE